MWVMGQMMYAVPALILLNVLLRRDGAGASAGPGVPRPISRAGSPSRPAAAHRRP